MQRQRQRQWQWQWQRQRQRQRQWQWQWQRTMGHPPRTRRTWASPVLAVLVLLTGCAPEDTTPASVTSAPTRTAEPTTTVVTPGSAAPVPTGAGSTVPSDTADAQVGPDSSPDGNSATPFDGNWVLVEGTVDGEPLTTAGLDTPLVLLLRPGEVWVSLDCNTAASADLAIRGAAFWSGSIHEVTEAGCNIDSTPSENAVRYVAAVERSRTIGLHDGVLHLTGPHVRLRYEPCEWCQPEYDPDQDARVEGVPRGKTPRG